MTPEVEQSRAQIGATSLVQRVARREEEAVMAFQQAYADTVFGFVFRRMGEQYEDAEEVTQDVFLMALSLAPNYDASCSVSTWLCGIARRCLTEFFRRQGREKRIPPHQVVALDEETLQGVLGFEAGSFPMEEAIHRVDAARLAEVMMVPLNEDEREVLLLRYVEEFSVREIAVLWQRTEKAIESLLTRARKKALKAGSKWV